MVFVCHLVVICIITVIGTTEANLKKDLKTQSYIGPFISKHSNFQNKIQSHHSIYKILPFKERRTAFLFKHPHLSINLTVEVACKMSWRIGMWAYGVM